jgi:hypothetical protein
MQQQNVSIKLMVLSILPVYGRSNIHPAWGSPDVV